MTVVADSCVEIAGTTGKIYSFEVGATFLTGVEVDVAASLVDSHVEGPASRLAQCSSIPFRSSRATMRRHDGTFYAINGTDHGTEVVPRTLAVVDPGWVLSQCGDLAQELPGWEVASAECDVLDFGVGMVVLKIRPTVDAVVQLDSLEELTGRVSDACSKVLGDLPERVSVACRESLHSDPSRLDFARGLNVETVAVLPPTGEVLWLWHLLRVSSTSDQRSELARRIAGRICPNDFEVMEQRNHTFAAAVHASVVCSDAGREDDAKFAAQAPRVQDPWWTLFWRLDRVLLALQLRLESSLDAHHPRDLKRRAEILLDVSARVSLLRSRLDSFLVSSGARDIAAWEVLGSAWDLPYRISVVEKKMNLLARSYADAVGQLAQARTSRVNFMIYVFTAFSLVATVIAVVQFAQGSVDERIAVRIAVVGFSILAAMVTIAISLRTSRLSRTRASLRALDSRR